MGGKAGFSPPFAATNPEKSAKSTYPFFLFLVIVLVLVLLIVLVLSLFSIVRHPPLGDYDHEHDYD